MTEIPENKEQSITEAASDLRIRRLHEIYVSVIAAMIIIFLIDFRLGSIEQVDNYINFAATLSSLMLALIAIFLTVSGNSELSKYINSAISLNAVLHASASKISRTADSSVRSSELLKLEIEKISERVSEVNAGMLIGFDQFKNQQNMQPSSLGDVPGGGPTLSFEENFFLTTVSFNGLLILWIASKFAGTGRILELSSLSMILQSTTNDYSIAFIVTCHSIKIMNAKMLISLPQQQSYEIISTKFQEDKLIGHIDRNIDRAKQDMSNIPFAEMLERYKFLTQKLIEGDHN